MYHRRLMPKCGLCSILEETIEKLAVLFLEAKARDDGIHENDPGKSLSKFFLAQAKEALDDATQAFQNHKLGSHPVGQEASEELQ